MNDNLKTILEKWIKDHERRICNERFQCEEVETVKRFLELI